MQLPSFNLLAQAVLSGVFIGALYGLIGLGLGLAWGLLRQINLSHFGLVFLGGYLSYQMAASWQVDPLLALVLVPPLFFLLGVGMQWVLSRKADRFSLEAAATQVADIFIRGLEVRPHGAELPVPRS